MLAKGEQFLSEDKLCKFNADILVAEEFNFYNKIDSHSIVVFLSCYTPFNLYSKSDKYEQKYALLHAFLIECLEHFETIGSKSVDISTVLKDC